MNRSMLMVLLGFLVTPVIAFADGNDDADNGRVFVSGGITDKPFITGIARTSIGGYTEAHWRWEREDGLTEELGFEMKRFNLFAYSPVSDRVRVAAELEFEEGGEEIKIEAALVDFEIHPSLNFRGGIILAPLGRFNLAHDSPANDLTDRPLVSTQIVPTALSEAGMGFYGSLYPSRDLRITYEAYGVNGFGDGVIGDPDGTRIAAGKGNLEDNNNRPSFVGRVTVSPNTAWEVGASVHTGPYNTWQIEELDIDERRSLTLFVLDADVAWRRFELQGEYATASIDVPSQSAIFADSQSGYYLQLNTHFGHGLFAEMPGSQFTGIVRYGLVDFDTDTDGDSHRRLTLGVNFRPLEDSVFKLDYQRNWTRDAFENQGKGAALIFSVATYF